MRVRNQHGGRLPLAGDKATFRVARSFDHQPVQRRVERCDPKTRWRDANYVYDLTIVRRQSTVGVS
jgi:hypothetical protein